MLPPFLHRLQNKANETKFSKFMGILKHMTVNMPLVEALELMSCYAKFMKNIVTKKRTMSYEPVDNIHHCNAISMRP